MLASVLAILLVFAISSCAAPAVHLDKDHTSVTVPVGGTVVIDLGTTNSSVGYRWVRVEGPGPQLAEVPAEAPKEPRPVGGPSEQSESFSAVSGGTTTLSYEYQVRPELTDRYALNGRRMTFTVSVQ